MNEITHLSCGEQAEVRVSNLFFKSVISPVLDRLDSETWHHNASVGLSLLERVPGGMGIVRLTCSGFDQSAESNLKTTVAGLDFANPVMVGAGWDKNAISVKALHELGFGGVEIGSVLERPQLGNARPRQFMIGKGVSLNRLGFNSDGMEIVAKNLSRYDRTSLPIGINIGKNKDAPNEDAPRGFSVVVTRLYEFASYFVVNVSSPNTPGLRQLQEKSSLTEILSACKEAMIAKGGPRPLFVKIAPELTLDAIDEVIDVVLDMKLSGIIATNTTVSADIKAKYGEKWRLEPGGLSGDDPDYRRMSTERVAHIFRETRGELTILGLGGVKDGATALEKIRAGASLVQLVTAIRGEGPSVARKITSEMSQWLQQEGVKSVADLIGIDAVKY